jgi:spermidine synthase
MGVTLPLGVRVMARQETARALGALYAANTLGGAIGALGAAYWILPALGLSATLYTAAGVSALAGAAAIALAATSAPLVKLSAHEPAVAERDAPRFEAIGIAALAFLSGFLVFAEEVASTHLLAVIIGNSAYAFGLILAAFLVCLFVGAAFAPRWSSRFGEHALSASLAAAALALAVMLPAWDKLPLLFAGLGAHITSFEGREAVRAGAAFAVLALPVTLMGLTFPLLLVRAARRTDVGAWVGRLTAINTLGAVCGALGTGYVLLPALGSQGVLRAVAVVFGVAAACLTLGRRPREGWAASVRSARAPLALAAAGVALALLVPAWDPRTLTAGTNVYFDSGGEPGRIVFMREDVHGGMTTVAERDDGVRTLYTNGKFQGNTGWEMRAQRFFAHYPCLFVKEFDRVLVVGLGTGTTLGTLAAYPWRRLDAVEISPSIVEAARTHFTGPNRRALDDPRVALHVDDARNWLLVNDERFDLIGIELSSVWFAGASSLYSREFYEIAKPRLAPGGVLQQWVQLHHIYDPVFATILNTLHSVFEHVALFYGGGQGILIASEEPLRWAPERARRFASDPMMSELLPDNRQLVSIVEDILLVGEGFDRFLDEAARAAAIPRRRMVSTDDNLYLEYETPRGNVLPWQAREELVARLRKHRDESAINALALEPRAQAR